MARTVVRAADLPPPGRINDEEFAALVEASQIPAVEAPWLRAILDELVAVFRGQIAAERREPSREDDREHLDRARSAVEKARYELNLASGRVAAAALRAAAAPIGEMTSTTWVRARFAGDPRAPVPIPWPLDEDAYRDPLGNRRPLRPTPIEDLTLDARVKFAHQRAPELARAVLDVLAEVLADARARLVMPPPDKMRLGGRKPLTQRRYLLANLARIWRRLGRILAAGEGSDFAMFAELVVENIGWPVQGLVAALPQALETERNWP
jgi:hypothetical protein